MNLLKSAGLVIALSVVVPAIAQTGVSDQATTGDSTSMNMQILRDKIQADKKLLVAQNMQLTDTETSAFWPIYGAIKATWGRLTSG